MSFLNTSARIIPVAVQGEGPNLAAAAWSEGLTSAGITDAITSQPTGTTTTHDGAGITMTAVEGVTVVASVMMYGPSHPTPDHVFTRSLTLTLPDGTKLFVSLPRAD